VLSVTLLCNGFQTWTFRAQVLACCLPSNANLTYSDCSLQQVLLSAATAARVRAQGRLYGICGGQNITAIGILVGLRFPLPIRIPPIAPHSSSIVRSWYNRPVSVRRTKWIHSSPAASCRSGLICNCQLPT
jgi:hypothetical protein